MNTQLNWNKLDDEAPDDGKLIILVRDDEPHTLEPIVGKFDSDLGIITTTNDKEIDVSNDEYPLLWAYFIHPTDKYAYEVDPKKGDK